MQNKTSEELMVAIAAVKHASKHALSYFGHNPKVSYKPNNSPVTIADKKTEEAIKNFILTQDKNACFVGEETGGDRSKKAFWVIDPIDGTNSFIRGIPHWAILLALCVDQKVIVGVSFMPTIHELLYAQVNHGAFLNEKRIHVSHVTTVRRGYISFGNTKYFSQTKGLLRLNKKALSAKGLGDAYSYHLLSNGRIDAVLEEGFSLWDVAPFKVIVEEAGGVVTTMKGDSWTIDDTTIIASNAKMHEEVIRIVNENKA